jgi:hypothetical protein
MRTEFGTLSIAFLFTNPDPMTVTTLVDILEKAGFKKVEEGRIEVPGATVQFGPPIVATSEESSVRYNMEEGQIILQSKSPEKMVSEFSAIHSGLEKHVYAELSELLRGIEIQIIARVQADRLPLETLGRFAGKLDLSSFESLLGEPVSLFTLRIFPRSAMASREDLRKVPEWFELTVEPYVKNPIYYFIRLIYRSRHKERILKLADDITGFVDSVMDLIVGGAD